MSAKVTPFSLEPGLKHIPNRFEAILCATQRAREIRKEDHKQLVLTEALKELANGFIERDEYMMKFVIEQSKKGERNAKYNRYSK